MLNTIANSIKGNKMSNKDQFSSMLVQVNVRKEDIHQVHSPDTNKSHQLIVHAVANHT